MPLCHVNYDNDAITAHKSAVAQNHTRLLAIAYGGQPDNIGWQSFPDEKAMNTAIEGWERAESMSLNCAFPLAVVNPQDSVETITAILQAGRQRTTGGTGYFPEAF